VNAEAAESFPHGPAAESSEMPAPVAIGRHASHSTAISNGNGTPVPRGRAARGVSRAARRELAAADVERKHIGQDLHDGVQQRLTALRIRLALAAERFQACGDTEASAALEGFGDEVDQAIDELRDLAHGIYPALLTTHGLGAALTAAARHAAQPVDVRASGVRRCTPAVEAAVYFSCLAAIDNAAKHAGLVHVSVELVSTSHGLRFTVRDAGTGFDLSRTPTGSGIANMRDRVSAVGGLLTIDSTPTLGTRVQGEIPDPWLHEPDNEDRP
jgi:signal transduction histidine kinase